MDDRILEVEVHREHGTYWASVPALPGCLTSAESLDELLVLLTDAVGLYVSETEPAGPEYADSLEDPTAEDAADQNLRVLTQVVGLNLRVEHDHRPAGLTRSRVRVGLGPEIPIGQPGRRTRLRAAILDS